MKRFSVIGAGNLGVNLINSLVKRGYDFKFIYRKSSYHDFDSHLSTDIGLIVQESDFVFIATQESKIRGAAEMIARETEPAGKIFFHTSNSLTAAELSGIRERGGLTASFSPLQTFIGFDRDSDLFPGIFFLAEGDPEALALAEDIARHLQAKVLVVDREEKVYFHMAAVSASNFLIAILKFAESQLKKGRGKFDINVLLPLIKQTLKNVESKGVDASLSGPVKRKESDIIRKHLALLQGREAGFYHTLSEYLNT